MKKSMRFCCFLFAFLVLLSGCQKEPVETVDVVGTWELTSVKLNNITYVEADILADYDYTFTFSENGEATATVLGRSYTTTYTVKNGWITFAHADLASVRLEIEGDTLTMELTKTGIGSGLVFSRK